MKGVTEDPFLEGEEAESGRGSNAGELKEGPQEERER